MRLCLVFILLLTIIFLMACRLSWSWPWSGLTASTSCPSSASSLPRTDQNQHWSPISPRIPHHHHQHRKTYQHRVRSHLSINQQHYYLLWLARLHRVLFSLSLSWTLKLVWTSTTPPPTESNCPGDICAGNICPGDICPYDEYLSCYWPDID